MELHAVFDKSYAKMNFELVYFFFRELSFTSAMILRQ